MRNFRNVRVSITLVTGDLETYEGNCYLGIDAGSTTTKAALVGEDGALLYSFYSNNNGSPLKTTIRAIQDIYKSCLTLPRSSVPVQPVTARH